MYVQETGRAGRDGLQSHAVILRHSDALKGRGVSPEMKSFVDTKDCRRSHILRLFNAEPVQPFARCCDNCDQSLATTSDIPSWLRISAAGTMQQQLTRGTIDRRDIESFKKELLHLNETTQSSTTVLPEHVTSTVYPSFLDNIMRNYKAIITADDVFKLGALSVTISATMIDILNKYAPIISGPSHLTETSDSGTDESSSSSSCD